MLKLYSQTYSESWRGFISVVASSEEKAREFMSKDSNYDPSEPVEVEDIVEGLTMGWDAS